MVVGHKTAQPPNETAIKHVCDYFFSDNQWEKGSRIFLKSFFTTINEINTLFVL